MWQKKALWLVRVDESLILKMHEADLRAKFSYQVGESIQMFKPSSGGSGGRVVADPQDLRAKFSYPVRCLLHLVVRLARHVASPTYSVSTRHGASRCYYPWGRFYIYGLTI